MLSRLKYFVLGTMFSFSFVSAFAQYSKIDSLLTLLKTDKEDTNKVIHLNLTSKGMMYFNPDSSLVLSTQALKLAEKINWKRGIAQSLHQLGTFNSSKGNYALTFDDLNKALVLWEEIKDKSGQAKTLCNLALLFSNQGNYSKALEYNFKVLPMAEELKDTKLLSICLGNIGLVYSHQKNYPKTLEYYFKSLEIAEKLNDKSLITNWLGNIGIVYMEQEDYDKALSYYLKSLKIAEEIGDKYEISRTYGNIGNVYKEQGSLAKQDSIRQVSYSMASSFYFKYLKMAEELGNKSFQAMACGSIGSLYTLEKKYDDAEKYLLNALKLNKEVGVQLSEMNVENDLVILYEKTGRFQLAMEHYRKAILLKENLFNADKDKEIARAEINHEFEKKESTIKAEQDKKDAIAGKEKQKQKIILYSISGSLFLVILLAFFIFKGYKQKKRSNEIITVQNKELEKLSIVASKSDNTIVICDTETELIWANEAFTNTFGYTLEEFKEKMGSTIIQISSNPDIRKLLNECIEKRSGVSYETKNQTKHNGERWFQTTLSPVFDETGKLQNIVFIDADITELKIIELQLQQKNKEITDSINYAQRIQSAILAKEEDIKKHFPISFLLYEPKDIVAGDFYFFEASDTHLFYAAADCTGHGVPGALVSVVCSNALTRCVKEFELTDPGKILDKARELVLETFKKSGQDIKDGMDISLLVKDTKTNSFKWAGANNPLWYLQNNETKEITANKQPIGMSENPQPFTTHTLSLSKGDTVFLFTDGYADQFGGPKGKKFKYKQLQELLIINSRTLPETKKILRDTFDEWKGNHEQVDDVCVIGVRL